MKPATSLGALALVITAGAPAYAADITVTNQPHAGVTMLARATDSPRINVINVAEIDLAAPGLRFRLTPPRGPRETVTQTTLDFLMEQGAQLAVNVHYFGP